MKNSKPTCSLSLDLDNQWSYMKTHGDAGWESFPSYLDLVVPRFLRILDEFGWKITVFVVGQDAALEKNREALQMIVDAGHEIGNHSFSHEPWLHLYSRQEIEVEIQGAEDAIKTATGKRPRGFRGPGYSLSRDVLEVLADRDYLYDASTLPTYLGPLARAFFFLKSNLTAEQKAERTILFGGLRNGLQPVKPYFWALGNQKLLEIPVSTIPLLKLPFHFSYLLYLATFSESLALLYLRIALAMCLVHGVEPSLLLHPLDFLGGNETQDLTFFPGMSIHSVRKLDLLNRFLRVVSDRFAVVSTDHYALLDRADLTLPIRVPEN